MVHHLKLKAYPVDLREKIVASVRRALLMTKSEL